MVYYVVIFIEDRDIENVLGLHISYKNFSDIQVVSGVIVVHKNYPAISTIGKVPGTLH